MGQFLSPRSAMIVRKAALVQLLPPDLFDDSISLERARDLFSEYVDQVEIENHSFCNRVCWFCPNAFINRRSKCIPMSDRLFDKLIGDLESIDYSGTVTWARYHEPLAHQTIFDRIGTVRRRLPGATLMLISNGDYLKKNTLALLEQAGLNRLVIDLYSASSKHRNSKAPTQKVANVLIRKLVNRTDFKLEQTGPFDYDVRDTKIKVTVEIPHYTPLNISTRGGLLNIPKRSQYQRTAVCLVPTRHLAVDWNGKGMLCCHTRADAPEHKNAIIGDLAQPDYTLFHFYRDLSGSRRYLVAPGKKAGVCKSCDWRDDGPNLLGRRQWLATTLNRIPGAKQWADRTWKQWIRRSF